VGDDSNILTSSDGVNWLRQLGAMASIAPPPVITLSLRSDIPQFKAVGSVTTSTFGPPPGPVRLLSALLTREFLGGHKPRAYLLL
jgi:hypothetical protein